MVCSNRKFAKPKDFLIFLATFQVKIALTLNSLRVRNY